MVDGNVTSPLSDRDVADRYHPDVTVVLDSQGNIALISESIERIGGWKVADLIGRSALELVHPDDHAYTFGSLLEASMHPGEHGATELRLVCADGSWIHTQVMTYNSPDDNDGRMVIAIRGIARVHDLPERRRKLEQTTLSIGAQCAGVSVDDLEDAVADVIGTLGEIVDADEVMVVAVGAAIDEVTSWKWIRAGATDELTAPTSQQDAVNQALCVENPSRLRASLGLSVSGIVEQPVVDDDGRVLGMLTLSWHTPEARRYWDEGNSPLLDAAARIVLMTARRVQRERLLAHRAVHDPLTGLGNRARLLNALNHELNRASGRFEGGLALAFCDLDRFKAINDTWGHEAGDEVLMAVASRLRESVRHGDLVCRVGGDEFVVLCPAVEDAALAQTLAERIAEQVQIPVALSRGPETSVSASIGLVLVHGLADGPLEAADLLRLADQAMYEAKAQDGRGIRFIDVDLAAE